MKKYKTLYFKYSAFTLAEVLITLGIIGIVAAITIPVLQKNIQDAQYKTAYKKAYSELSQIVSRLSQENSFVFAEDFATYKQNFRLIMSQFNITKDCTNGNGQSCWNLNGELFDNYDGGGWPRVNSTPSFLDISGSSWSMFWEGSPWILLDTNGFAKPNQYGKDRFAFYLLDRRNFNSSGIPVKIKPFDDNSGFTCASNKCGTVGDNDYQTYYGTSWLYK